jgi:gluconate 5-dehydrogenase
VDLSNLFSVKGKTIILTGASSGIGVTMAEGLAAAGANVVLAARRVDAIQTLARKLAQAGGTALAVHCDVADSASVAAMVKTAWEHFGYVDVLVNNAGVAADAGLMPEHIPDEAFAQTIQVNVMGTWYCAQQVGQRMLADGRGGSIINIASIMGIAGQQNGPAAYQTSKAAVINMTRNLANSWADRKVRVNAIAPGWFPSEMTAGWFAIPQFLARFLEETPMNRVGEPEELMGPLLFLASDASSFVTGHTLVVDGGVTASVGGQYTPELFEIATQVLGPAGTRIMPPA